MDTSLTFIELAYKFQPLPVEYSVPVASSPAPFSQGSFGLIRSDWSISYYLLNYTG